MPPTNPTLVTQTRLAAAPGCKRSFVTLGLLALIAIAPLLGACHTTAGAGQDLSATGDAITHSARKATP